MAQNDSKLFFPAAAISLACGHRFVSGGGGGAGEGIFQSPLVSFSDPVRDKMLVIVGNCQTKSRNISIWLSSRISTS